MNTILNLFKVKNITILISMLFVVLVYKEKLPVEITTITIGMLYYFSKEYDNEN